MADSLSIERISNFGLAAVMARRGISTAQIGAALSIDAPLLPAWSASGELALIGTGDGTWLAFCALADSFWANRLDARLAGLASVSDQSSGYALFTLKGARARKLLQRGAAIDFDPAAFRPGSAVTTVIAHIGAIIWQIDDTPTYNVAVFKSYAESFTHWIEVAAVD